MELPDSPVTLVVKAANQKYADQTVECALGWTIRRLKRHLASVYPNKPSEAQQRLIYSGQLLKDHLTLGDILKQVEHEDDDRPHTVHLVCAPSTHTDSKVDRTVKCSSNSTDSNASSTNQVDVHATPAQSFEIPSTRTTADPGLATAIDNSMQNTEWSGYHDQASAANFAWMQQFAASQTPSYTHPQYANQWAWWTHYSTEQQRWLAHYYAAASAPTPEPVVSNTVEAQHEAPLPDRAAVDGEQAPDAQPDAPLPVNAAMDDDDDDWDELGARDWLDYVYAASRLVVLGAIIYFYSSVGRFAAVVLAALLFYLYKVGLLAIARTPRRPRAQPPREDAARPATGPDAEAEQDAPNERPLPGPSIVRTIANFIAGFFASLIPQQPAPVRLD